MSDWSQDVCSSDLEQLQPGFLAGNPRGLLPALLLDDGTVIDESVAICRYLEMLCPEPNLFGRDARETALIESWTRRIDSDCYAAVVYVFRNSLPALQDRAVAGKWPPMPRSEEHTSELQSLMRISYAVFCV